MNGNFTIAALLGAVMIFGSAPASGQDQENEPAESSVRTGSLTSPARAGSLTIGKPSAGSVSSGKPQAGSMTLVKPSAGSMGPTKPSAGSAASGIGAGSSTAGTAAGSLSVQSGSSSESENLSRRGRRSGRTREATTTDDNSRTRRPRNSQR